MRLDEPRQTFDVRLVMHLMYKDGHKRYYPSNKTNDLR